MFLVFGQFCTCVSAGAYKPPKGRQGASDFLRMFGHSKYYAKSLNDRFHIRKVAVYYCVNKVTAKRMGEVRYTLASIGSQAAASLRSKGC